MNKIKLIKLAKELRLEGSVETIPDGFYSREQLSKLMGFKTDYVCRFLKELKNNKPNKIQTKRFKVRNSSGSISSIPYYKITV